VSKQTISRTAFEHQGEVTLATTDGRQTVLAFCKIRVNADFRSDSLMRMSIKATLPADQFCRTHLVMSTHELPEQAPEH
jgi:hypothetical protein